MRTLRFLLRKEMLQLFRDKFLLRQMLLMPLIQLLILSSAATFEVKRAHLYVVDLDRSAMSRGLVTRLQASGRFVVADASASLAVAGDAMLARRVGVVLTIPAEFERAIVRNQRAAVQLVVNAEDGAAAAVTNGYAAQIVAAYATEMSAPTAPGRSVGPAVDVRVHGWYNPQLLYRDYMVPGILVQLVTVIGTLMTAMNIVREKEMGTLDQLSVTPLSRSVFIAAKLIPLWLIALAELSFGLLVARFVFHVPMLGSVPLVFAAAAIYLGAALGIGLFVSAVANTQQQAMFVTFFIIMVYLLMSGLFTPIRSMPHWAQTMAQFNPVMHFIGLMRAVLLKGAGVRDVLVPLAALFAFAVVMLPLAVRQYGRQVG